MRDCRYGRQVACYSLSRALLKYKHIAWMHHPFENWFGKLFSGS